ncbi:MAG: Hsp20/alpha crystallin family protein [Candidatus Nitrosocosmicus sp.]
MSIRDIDNYDWFKRFFGGSTNSMRRGFFDRDVFKEFEDMQHDMERMFNQFSDIQSNAPKELIREYQTPDGEKVREVGPIVYGYSMTIGPDGKPKVREFGNVKSLGAMGTGKTNIDGNRTNAHLSAEREPLVDVNSTDTDVKVILEMPGIRKEDIKINAYDGEVEVIANDPKGDITNHRIASGCRY